MDKPERKDTAQRALVYVGVAVAVVILLVLIWYAIDVVLLAFIAVLVAILLRAPADWLVRRTGMREAWALALVGVVAIACLAGRGVLFGRGIAVQALELTDRIPEIVQTLWFEPSHLRALGVSRGAGLDGKCKMPRSSADSGAIAHCKCPAFM
jgi:predicted PurR-regulated permease PerM